MAKAAKLFAVKIAAEVAFRAGCSITTAERWKRGEREIGAEELLRLVSDEQYGHEFLAAVWGEIPEPVRVRFIKKVDLERRYAAAEQDLRRQQDEIARLRMEMS